MHLSLKRWYHHAYVRIYSYSSSKDFLAYYVLGFLFCINIFVMWPGQMSPDSYTQYKAAIQGIFDDHHPPMMSLVWGFLNSFYKGPGLLFLAHLFMMYGACLLLIMSATTRAIKLFYSLFPLIPHVLFYSSMLWKDVGFAFSFLLSVALLHFYIHQKKRISLWAASAIGLLLFYGSAVKFQGQYVAPIIIFGLCYCLDNYRITFKTVLKTLLGCGFFLCALVEFNDFFVPPSRKAHSWQCVKIYDLAAMSLYAQKPLFPAFLQESPDFSMHKVQERFNHKRVDDLFMPPGNPLRLGKNETERMQLLVYWQETAWHYLPLYVYHRFMNWWTMVTNMPLQRFESLNFSEYGGLHWFVVLQKAAAQQPSTGKEVLLHYAGISINNFLYGLRYCFKFVFLIPFMTFYFFLGLVYFKRYGQGMSLILINGLSLWFLGVLFFCSMASDMRYAYIVACMTHTSHGIAFDLWRKRTGKNYDQAVGNKG